MLPFFNNTNDTPHFQLEQLVIGWSEQEMGFMAALGFDISSLPKLLSDIGFDLPEGRSLDKNQVEFVLAYEKVKSKEKEGEPAQQGYATYAKITITGSLKLSDLIDTGDFNGLPELEKVELVFEMGKQISKDQQAKDALVGFKMYFKTNSRSTIIEVLYEKETTSDKPALPAAPNENQAVTINKKFRAVMYSPDRDDSVQLDFNPYVPIELNVKDMFILQTSRMNLENPSAKGTITEETTLFGLDLDMQIGLDLSKLPLIGKDLTDTQLSFKAFRVLYSRKEVKAKDLGGINDLLGKMNVPTVVVQQSTGEKTPDNAIGLKKGFNFQGTIILGNEKIELFSGSKGNDSQKDPDKALAANEEPTDKDVAQSETPAPVGKKYGPVTVHSMSMALKKGFHLDLTASLELGPLELDLIGFLMEFPIQKLLPKPPAQENDDDDDGLKMSIQGMNINYHKPPLTIDGGFMKQPPDDTGGVTYSGALSIGLKAFQLTAFGSLGEASKDGDKYKTFFVYGFLATPPLGPPILQLTGVALGFGYNRQVELPAPEYIDLHPLVLPVVSEEVPDFQAMNTAIPPSKGDYWAALGVRIESFKMIKTFVLAIFKFGHEFEIDLLGRVSLVLPKNPSGSAAIPPLAKLDIGIVATILPERGVVEINGRVLPGSFIFEPSAVLSGGFAFLVIAKDQREGKWNGGQAGDFVVSFGGYNPNYTPKPYYPQAIPRMGLTWTPYHNLSVAADMYFTVVPEAFMFGGHLSVNFNAGGEFSIFVHFEAGLDFIVWWQPKRYIGHAYANLQVGATVWLVTWHKVEFDLSGDLTFWGPPFAGHASFKVHVLVTFTVDVDFGPAPQAAPPISWDAFKETILPEKDKVVSTTLTNGLMGKIETADKKTIYLVNPKELALDISTAFPVKQINVKKDADINQKFGIAPMAAKDIGSDLQITLTKDGKPFDVSNGFAVKETLKNYPASIWRDWETTVITQNMIPPPPPQDKNLSNLCGGMTLKAKEPTKGTVYSIDSDQFDLIAMPIAPWATGDFVY